MRNSLSCFVIFFVGFSFVACTTQRKIVITANHDLVGFARGSEAENGFFSVAANAAKRRQFAYLVAMRNQIQERADPFFLKIAVQPTYINTLPSIHEAQHIHNVGEDLTFVDEQHFGRFHFFGVLLFQFLNGGAHDAGNHGAVMG